LAVYDNDGQKPLHLKRILVDRSLPLPVTHFLGVSTGVCFHRAKEVLKKRLSRAANLRHALQRTPRPHRQTVRNISHPNTKERNVSTVGKLDTS
jgi:hypothetical protein